MIDIRVFRIFRCKKVNVVVTICFFCIDISNDSSAKLMILPIHTKKQADYFIYKCEKCRGHPIISRKFPKSAPNMT